MCFFKKSVGDAWGLPEKQALPEGGEHTRKGLEYRIRANDQPVIVIEAEKGVCIDIEKSAAALFNKMAPCERVYSQEGEPNNKP